MKDGKFFSAAERQLIRKQLAPDNAPRNTTRVEGCVMTHWTLRAIAIIFALQALALAWVIVAQPSPATHEPAPMDQCLFDHTRCPV